MSYKTKKIVSWLLLFLGITAATSFIGYKTDGFTTNPFDEEKEVEVDENQDEVETENNEETE